MRIAIVLAALAMGTASHAMAADPVAPMADLVTTTQAALVAAPMVEARFGAAMGRRFETRMVLVADQFADDGTALRHRFASSMVEFYPLANSGFHLSGGVHFYGITNFTRDADKLTNNLLWSPSGRGFNGVRTGFNRKTPAMTFGYTQTVAKKMVFGLEAGTLLGRANASVPRLFGRSFGRGDDGRINPLANLVFGLKF